MKLPLLTERFYKLVSPDIPNEWDVEEVLEPFIDKSDTFCKEIFTHIPVIWPVSHSLCYDFLRLLPKTLDHLSLEQIPHWIGIILDHYETHGLRAAQRFMQDDLTRYLSQLHGGGGLGFTSIEKRLLPYIRGVAGTELQLRKNRVSYTDSTTIFVPEELEFSSRRDINFLLYKFILTFQWGFITQGSFITTAPPDYSHTQCNNDVLWLRAFLDEFKEPQLARDIYHCLESIRVLVFLNQELPGLMRAAKQHIFPQLSASLNNHPLRPLQQVLLTENSEQDSVLKKILSKSSTQRYLNGQASTDDSLKLTADLFFTLQKSGTDYCPISPFPFQGALRLQAVENARKIQNQKLEENFVDLMAAYLHNHSLQEASNHTNENRQNGYKGGLKDTDISVILDSELTQAANQEQPSPIVICLDNAQMKMPPELQECAQNCFNEFGHFPTQFISSAAGKAGHAILENEVQETQTKESAAQKDTILYDEWDYRRQGYRKNWCTLHFKNLPPIHSPFVQNTLNKYRGLTIRLRRQFEMMRSNERFMKRQRDGDDIDLDALIESIADSHAGISSSDRLFIRLQRNERDIAVLFLVDQSNSTSGWVNNAIKESLLLMSEAMEVLGDRYGIYGFSGMRRSRCELFHIKHLDEPYDDKVKERITSIVPCEYTRMGPPIRHAISLLKDVDAKARLIITLSDGKPEDYDDYKGKYAIEDTRHALLEAKTADIHPFCITIDHQAKDYMQHMYGPANYIFIDNVRKLPLRMSEIYRILTS